MRRLVGLPLHSAGLIRSRSAAFFCLPNFHLPLSTEGKVLRRPPESTACSGRQHGFGLEGHAEHHQHAQHNKRERQPDKVIRHSSHCSLLVGASIIRPGSRLSRRHLPAAHYKVQQFQRGGKSRDKTSLVRGLSAARRTATPGGSFRPAVTDLLAA